jgi:predicted transcriptional regulator
MGAIIGAVVGTVTVIVNQQQAKTLALRVLPMLRERGPMTVPEVVTALGMKGMNAQGKVAITLAHLVKTGQVLEQPVPPGTKRLEKIKIRKYVAKA